MPYLSLTSWSLHRNLGPLRWTVWDAGTGTQQTSVQEQPQTLALLELPAALAEKGFAAMEVCHFHFPDTDEAYLARLREAVDRAGIRFHTVLVDYGDVSTADERRRAADLAFLKRWVDIAAGAGAERVRIIAGEASPDDRDALERAAEALAELCDYADGRGVRIVTENFKPLTSTADNCLALLEACGDRLGLTSDFGNFHGEGKFGELARTVPRSESVHAKAHTDADGVPDATEFTRCLDVVRQSGYEGPLTLVYDGPGDMWAGIERVRTLAEPYLG